MYKNYRVRKKNGKFRVISEPSPELKAMQWAILAQLETIPLLDCVHGFVQGRDVVSNATPHKQQRYVLNIDVKDFFPSIKAERCLHQVSRWRAWTSDELDWMEAICFWEGVLPQGAPTSPVLANIYMHPFDVYMELLAKRLGLSYTRYAD